MPTLALLVGRFHALTRAQETALAALGSDPDIERIACVITSADHAGTRRNPLGTATREAILRPALEAAGKPFDILTLNDIPDDDRWAAYVAGAVGRAIGRTLVPGDTRVHTANREVARLFSDGGFQVAIETAPSLTPHELLQRVVDGQPWEAEASASTCAVYAAERVPARLRAIFADRRRTDDGELAVKRDFDSYGAQMDASLAQKLDDILPWVQPGKIVDKGCGTGKLMVELSRRFPRSAFVGVDLSREFLRRCDENTYASGDLELVLGDAAAPAVAPGTASTVIYSSIMHEIYTYSGYDQAQVDRALASAAKELGPGGHVIVRDGVSAGRAPWRMRLLDAETAACFVRFAAEFKHGQGAAHERVAPDTVRLSAHLANEFF
jgi:SAM-dependent methyltransferase/nicotinamide mononucleotide adenylyltransferase